MTWTEQGLDRTLSWGVVVHGLPAVHRRVGGGVRTGAGGCLQAAGLLGVAAGCYRLWAAGNYSTT